MKVAIPLSVALLLVSGLARAQFAEPPRPALAQDPEAESEHPIPVPDDYPMSRSSLRFLTGPALRLGTSTQAGLYAAVDVGQEAAGLRLSGTWAEVGTPDGVAEYTAELWLDFGYPKRIRPLVGAGVALVQLAGSREDMSLGAAVARGGIQYLLPVHHADARIGLDLRGTIPALSSAEQPLPSPWATLMLTLGAGF